MPLTAYPPLDLRKYKRHEKCQRFSPRVEAGAYVYVQDCFGVVWLAPDAPHRHPRVLGMARPAVAAGELTLGERGEVLLVTNQSGTFRCGPDSLLTAVGGLVAQGAIVRSDAIAASGELS